MLTGTCFAPDSRHQNGSLTLSLCGSHSEDELRKALMTLCSENESVSLEAVDSTRTCATYEVATVLRVFIRIHRLIAL